MQNEWDLAISQDTGDTKGLLDQIKTQEEEIMVKDKQIVVLQQK